MIQPASRLFADQEGAVFEPAHATGLLPAQYLRALVEQSREIRALEPIEPDQLQPASLDLRLGARVHRVRASFLPGADATVQDKIDALAMHQFELDDAGAVLEKGCVYIVPLLESLALKKRTSAIANPKSSIGRIDVFTRLITDQGTEFDRVRANYHGPLYAEISPRTFSILVRKGDRLNQIRIKRGTPVPSDDAMRRLNERDGLSSRRSSATTSSRACRSPSTSRAQGRARSSAIGRASTRA
jgi:dCTP deaminase